MKFEDIKKIAVLGSGTMGPGIAQSYAMGGYEVAITTRSIEKKLKAQNMIIENLNTFVQKNLLPRQEAETVYNRISYFETVEKAVQGCQFIQETVAERLDVKTEIYEALDKILPKDAIIVTNTSSLNPFELIMDARKPYFATAHWYAPPHILPLVEVAKGDKTGEETMDIVMAVLNKCGKTPVRMEKFVPGYIINRIQILLNTEVFYLLDNGICTPEMIDLAVKASFMPRGLILGLVQRYDFTGLDISANNIINASYQMPETSKRPKALFEHVDKGELGVKSGKGFYDYEGRDPIEVNKKRDELLIDVIKATQEFVNTKI